MLGTAAVQSPEEDAGQTKKLGDPVDSLASAKKETLKVYALSSHPVGSVLTRLQVQNVLAVIGDRWRELLIDKAKLRQRVNQLEDEMKSLQAQLEMECRAKEAAENKAKEAEAAAFKAEAAVNLVRNIPALPASEWSIVRIYPRFLRLSGPS
eukprot:3590394-Pyramimonas_sp.AAC.1